MLIRLRPVSRGLAETCGSPTSRLRLRPRFSWKTPAETRFNPKRSSFSRRAVKMCVSLAMAFCARRGTLSPKPGMAANEGPVKGSYKARSAKL